MTNLSKFVLCFLLIGASVFTSCSNSDNNSKPSIYSRLGGTTLVQDPDAAAGVMIEKGRLSYRKVVVSAITLIAADANSGAGGNLSAHFMPLLTEVNAGNTTNYAELVDNLTDFFSHNTGGTSAVNNYMGLDMATAHNPALNSRMGVKATSSDYTKFEGYIGLAAQQNGIGANTQLYADIVDVLESLRATIVQA